MTYEDRRRPAERIAAEIRAQIMSGALGAGAELPSTSALSEFYGVAPNTVRSAVETLRGEGLLLGEPGRGVFVRARQPLVIDASAFITPQPGKFAYRLLDVRELAPPVEVAGAFGCDLTVVLRQRLLSHDDEPVEMSWSYYPHELAEGTDLARRARIRGGAHRVLAEIGRPIDYLDDQVSVRPPTHEEATTLELPGGFPVLRQIRVGYTADHQPVEVSILIKGGHRFALRYRVSD